MTSHRAVQLVQHVRLVCFNMSPVYRGRLLGCGVCTCHRFNCQLSTVRCQMRLSDAFKQHVCVRCRQTITATAQPATCEGIVMINTCDQLSTVGCTWCVSAVGDQLLTVRCVQCLLWVAACAMHVTNNGMLDVINHGVPILGV